MPPISTRTDALFPYPTPFRPRAANAAKRADREATTAHLRRAELAFARLGGQLAGLGRDFHHALAVAVAHHRHHQPVGRVGGETDVDILLQRQVLAACIARGVERSEERRVGKECVSTCYSRWS